jgi:hypothetical protein
VSKFIEKLQQSLRGSAPPIGFRKVTETESSPLLVAVNLADFNRKELKQLVTTGIDAAALSVRELDPATFEQWNGSLDGIPLGLMVEDDNNVEVKEFIKRGCDFLVFGLKAPFEVIDQEKAGKIVRVETSLESGLLRSVNDLPVDAVLIATPGTVFTVEHLLACYRFAALISKPLLVAIRSPLTAESIKSLHQAGVNGLFLDTGFPSGAISDLKKAIQSLPRTQRKRPSAVPLLPKIGTETQPEAEEEEED